MTLSFDSGIIQTTKVLIRSNYLVPFAEWQSNLNRVIASFPGFISLEILSPQPPVETKWVIVQRFDSSQSAAKWKNSKEHNELMQNLRTLIGDNDAESIQEIQSEPGSVKVGVTEVFVTEVTPEMDAAYRSWIAKIHQAEAKFPGFKGVYVQSPTSRQGKNWITLLQFDTPKNLENWITSPERQAVLDEGKDLIASMESHRVISPYAGWFANIVSKGEAPPLWKQTMLILLVLFPIVMLEIKYLNPLTMGLGLTLSTFIGNAISVSLISWPSMPIAIYFLKWWLVPIGNKKRINILGTCIVLALYLLEIAIFWNF